MKRPFQKKQYLLFSMLMFALGASISWHPQRGQVFSFAATDAAALNEGTDPSPAPDGETTAPAAPQTAEAAETAKAGEEAETAAASASPEEYTYKVTIEDSGEVQAAGGKCEDCERVVTISSTNEAHLKEIVAAITEKYGEEQKDEPVAQGENEGDEEDDEEDLALKEPKSCAKKRSAEERLSCNVRSLIRLSEKDDSSKDQLMDYYKNFMAESIEKLLESGDERERVVQLIADLQSKMRHSTTSDIKEDLSNRLRTSFDKDAGDVSALAQRARGHEQAMSAYLEASSRATDPQAKLHYNQRAQVEQANFIELDQSMRRELQNLNERYRSTDIKIAHELQKAVQMNNMSRNDVSSIYTLPFALPVGSMLRTFDPYRPLGLSSPSLATTDYYLNRYAINDGRNFHNSYYESILTGTPRLLENPTLDLYKNIGRTLPRPSVSSTLGLEGLSAADNFRPTALELKVRPSDDTPQFPPSTPGRGRL